MSRPSVPKRLRPPRWPAASLRTYLVVVIVLATVPLAMFAWQLLREQAQHARQEARASLGRSAEAVALLVERELGSSTDLLSGLAYHDALQRGDVAAFALALERGLALRPGWQGVDLLTPDGERLMASDSLASTAHGAVPRLPRAPVDEAALERVRTTLQPTVSGLVERLGGAGAGVMVPVLVRGGLRYVLAARIGQVHWKALLDRTDLGPGGALRLVDGRGTTIAQGGDDARSLSDDTVVRQPVVGTPWAVIADAPLPPADPGLPQVGAAGALSLLAGLLLALVVARRVAEPLRALARGEPIDGGQPVREIAQLQAALRDSAAAREAARRALQAKADEFEAVFAASPAALAITLDAAGTQVRVNPALARLLGCGAGVHPAAPWFDGARARVWREGRPLPLAEQPLQRAAAEGAPTGDAALELVRADGSRIELEVRAVPLADSRGAVAAFVDATARHELDRQRERSAQAKDEFIAMVGHELRNPLGAIGAAVELLNRSHGQGDLAASARRVIERQTRQMAQLINDLQDVARIGAGKLTLERQALDVAQRVWRPLDAMRLAGRLKDHALTLELAPVEVDADPVRLEQMVVNLLTNAVKYTPAGGSIGLDVRREGDEAVVEVHDSGIGIAPDQLARIFEPFVQTERSAGRRQGGMGIGLTLVRRLVDLHGGSISASSAGTQLGSRFTVRLPARGATAATPAPRWRGRHVLVLGTGEPPPFALEAPLAGVGARVTSCSRAEVALQALARAGDGIDLVLVDLALPAPEIHAFVAGAEATPTRAVRLAVHATAGQAEGFAAVVGLPLETGVLEHWLPAAAADGASAAG